MTSDLHLGQRLKPRARARARAGAEQEQESRAEQAAEQEQEQAEQSRASKSKSKSQSKREQSQSKSKSKRAEQEQEQEQEQESNRATEQEQERGVKATLSAQQIIFGYKYDLFLTPFLGSIDITPNIGFWSYDLQLSSETKSDTFSGGFSPSLGFGLGYSINIFDFIASTQFNYSFGLSSDSRHIYVRPKSRYWLSVQITYQATKIFSQQSMGLQVLKVFQLRTLIQPLI